MGLKSEIQNLKEELHAAKHRGDAEATRIGRADSRDRSRSGDRLELDDDQVRVCIKAFGRIFVRCIGCVVATTIHQ
jgi:hypothetical protein